MQVKGSSKAIIIWLHTWEMFFSKKQFNPTSTKRIFKLKASFNTAIGIKIVEILLYEGVHAFFIRKLFIRKWAPKTKNLKKILRKSPTSNVWAASFRNTDF